MVKVVTYSGNCLVMSFVCISGHLAGHLGGHIGGHNCYFIYILLVALTVTFPPLIINFGS